VTFVRSWVTALRVARREARRSKGRSALVIVMIAFPVLGLTFAAVSFDMFRLTPAERADRAMGAADARVHWDHRGAVQQTVDGTAWPANPDAAAGGEPVTAAGLIAKLPVGTRALPLRRGTVRLRTAAGAGELDAVIVDATDRLTRGYVEVLEGRAPTGPSEVALTTQAVGRLGQTLGGTILAGDGVRSFTVVGLVEFPSLLAQVVLFGPAAETAVSAQGSFNRAWLVDTPLPLDWASVLELNRVGIAVASREVFANPPPADEVGNAYGVSLGAREFSLGVLVGGLGLLEVVLLAGPAFAVGARRRQRQLALVAANGGTPAHVRRIVLADGVVLGGVGAAGGIALGILTAFVARPFFEEYLAHARAGGYRVYPLALAAIAGLAIVTGLLAALVPAFITARQDVVAALAGRRGITRSRKRWLFAGLGLVALGTAVVVYGTLSVGQTVVLAGLVLGEIGMVLCTPALVGIIARVGPVLPLAPRVALRDAARNRAAAAPAISAVMAAVAGSVAIGLYFSSQRALDDEWPTTLPVGTITVQALTGDPDHPADGRAIEAAVRAGLPVTAIRPLSWVSCPPGTTGERYCAFNAEYPPEQVCPYAAKVIRGDTLTKDEMRAARRDRRCDDDPYGSIAFGQVYVDDGTTVAAISGASADEVAAAAAVLRAGGVVVRDRRLVKDGRMTFAVVNAAPSQTQGPREWAAGAPRISLPAYVLTTGNPGMAPVVSTAAVAKAGLGSTAGSIIVETSRPPTQEELDGLRLRLERLNSYLEVTHRPTGNINVVLWFLAGAAGLITLGAAAIATGLAAADGRADLSTLAAIGASPRVRRGLSLSQSGVIAGLGSMLGAVAGLGAAVAIIVALNQRYADIWPGPPVMPIVLPWISLVVSLLVVPLIAMLGAGTLTRSRLPIERRI
jgi:putative ABC transport system permease protein